MIGLGGFFASVASELPVNSPAWQLWLQGTLLGTGIVWTWIAWRKTVREIESYSLGHRGERAVATLLAELGKEGDVLINDVETKGTDANIDHVLIGPPGILVIETKCWTKPDNLQAGAKPTISAREGKLLRHGVAVDRDPIAQARACADHIRRMIEPLPEARTLAIHPVVLFPGWWITPSAETVNGVQVRNAKMIFPLTRDLTNQTSTLLTRDQIGRISNTLAREVTREIDAQIED